MARAVAPHQLRRAARVLLDVELPGSWPGARQLPAHALAHLAHFLAQGVAAHVAHQELDAQLLEPRAQACVASHRARMQQRLVLPGPGFLLLVFREGADARDQHAALARRTQPHVHLVEPAGRRMHGEHVDHALREADEEHLVVDGLRRVGFRVFGAGVVQEHEVKVRGVTELPAA